MTGDVTEVASEVTCSTGNQWGGGGGGGRSMTRHGPIVMYFSGLNTQMHHSWENLGILSAWILSSMGFCPPGLLSPVFSINLGRHPSSLVHRDAQQASTMEVSICMPQYAVLLYTHTTLFFIIKHILQYKLQVTLI